MKDKLLTDQQLLGERGIALISERVAAMGLVWRSTTEHDVGIDGEIEIRDVKTKRMCGLLVKVQSKAVTEFKNETSENFDYWVDQRDLNYWLSVNLPVILVVSKPDTNEAYWLSVKDFVKANSGTKRFRFSKNDHSLDIRNAGKLIDLAKSGAVGIYSPPIRKSESLICNLLPVTLLPERLYLATTAYRNRKDLFDKLAGSDCRIPGDFILGNMQLISVRDLADPIYSSLCEQGTIEELSVDEWANSEDPDKRRNFVQLLNACLREKLRAYDLFFDKDTQCYFFRASNDGRPYKFGYQATIQLTDREVFKDYKQSPDGRTTCWRHSAMKANFYRYGRRWYLEVTPTYFFTYNGLRQHRKHGEYLKQMKEMEKNYAVRGQLIMWAGILADAGDMYRPYYPFLQFGHPLVFEAGVGIDDESWRSRDQATKADVPSVCPLFEVL